MNENDLLEAIGGISLIIIHIIARQTFGWTEDTIKEVIIRSL